MADPYAAFSSPDPYAAFASRAEPASSASAQPAAPEQRPDLGMNTAFTGGPIIDRLAAAGQTYLPEALGGTGMDYSTNLQANREETEAAQQKHPVAAAAGEVAGAIPYLAVPEATLGRGLGLLDKMKEGGKIAGAIGATQGVLSSPDWTNVSETLKSGAEGGVTGTVLGGAFPLAGAAIGKLASPFKIAPERQAMVNALRGANVPVTAGQTIGSPLLTGLERQGIGGEKAAAGQMKDFTGGLMEAGGIPAKNAMQLESAGKDIGGQFGSLASRNTLIPDEQLGKDIHEAAGTYNKLISPTETVSKTANDLLARLGAEGKETATLTPMSGEDYQDFRSELSKKAYALRNTNPDEADSYRGMAKALDSAMERSIAANNPEDAAAFKEARRSYGNFQDIAKAASKLKGEDRVSGTITPSRMQAVLSSGNKAVGYAQGKGDLAGLTQAGVGILGTPPQAGSPLAHILAHGLVRAGVGGALGSYEGGPGGTAAGMLAGLTAPKAAGTVLRSGLAQALLKKLAAPAVSTGGPTRAALAATLAAGQRRNPTQSLSQQ